MQKSVRKILITLPMVLTLVAVSACQESGGEGASGSTYEHDNETSHDHDSSHGDDLSDEVKICDGFFPKNDLYIGPEVKNFKGVDQTKYNNVIAAVEAVYAPIVKAKGAKLQMNKLWSSGEVNAYASRSGTTWKVDMHGGLARHGAISADGLALITCHEVGHHLGGAPRYSGDWAAVEGQSDYFATLKCLRRVFEAEMPNWNGNVDREAQEKCDAAFGDNTLEAKLCGRIAMAGKSAALLNQALGGGSTPRFDAKDTRVVSKTEESHPATQCRMDTYFNGSLCRVSYKVDVSSSDHLKGVCKNTVNEEYGARPRCWYKPTTNTPPINDPIIPPLDPTDPPPVDPPPVDPPPVDPPPTDPPPVQEPQVANTPTLNKVTELKVSNPNASITMRYDVSNFKKVGGFYFEILGPNLEFREPNGVNPDPRAIPGGSLPKTKGSLVIIPAQHLPGWGVYKIRIIPLDSTGRVPVGVFSNPAILRLER